MPEPNGHAIKTASTFRMECAVAINIKASPGKVWSTLTNAAGFPKWNSTVTRIDGQIALGQRLAIQVPAAPGRTFRPRVVELENERHMVWADGAAPMFTGRRTYTLSPRSDGSVDFAMAEVFRGLMLPMIKGSLPDFAPVFERYAEDLKRESERSS